MSNQRPKIIRIQGMFGDPRATYVKLTDIDNGEEIANVYSVIAILDVEMGIHATLLRYASTPEGRLATEAREPIHEQVNTKLSDIDFTAVAIEVDAPAPNSVLETFKSLASWPVIQYLTWHISLVEGWKFDDMADFSIVPVPFTDRWGVVNAAWQCRFAFRDGSVTNLFVQQTRQGKFVAQREQGEGAHE